MISMHSVLHFMTTILDSIDLAVPSKAVSIRRDQFDQMQEFRNHRTAPNIHFLLEGNETRRVGGTDTGTTVLDGLAVELVSQMLTPQSTVCSSQSLEVNVKVPRTKRWRTQPGSGRPSRA